MLDTQSIQYLAPLIVSGASHAKSMEVGLIL